MKISSRRIPKRNANASASAARGAVSAVHRVDVATYASVVGRGLRANSEIPTNAVIAEMEAPISVDPQMVTYFEKTVCVKIKLGDDTLSISGPDDLLLHARGVLWVDLAWSSRSRWYCLNHAPSKANHGFKEANVFLVPGPSGAPQFITKRPVEAGEELLFTYNDADPSWPPRERGEAGFVRQRRPASHAV